MVEFVGAGTETPQQLARRKADWAARDKEVGKPIFTLEDTERLLRSTFTPAQLAAAKRDRGKPMP